MDTKRRVKPVVAHHPSSPTFQTSLPACILGSAEDKSHRRKMVFRRLPKCGLGLFLPTMVSLPQISSKHQAIAPNNVFIGSTDSTIMKESAFDRCSAPRTPILSPLNLDDEISPILPLSHSLNHISQLASASGAVVQNAHRPKISRLSTSEYIHNGTNVSGPVRPQDIITAILKDGHDSDDELKPTFPVFGTPTADIAEQGTPLPDFPSPDDTHSPALSEYGHSPIALSAIPIYHGQQRRIESNYPSSNNAGNLCYATPKRIRDPASRERYFKQPIETTSPSMTPSPTSSPTLRGLFIQGKGGEGEQLPFTTGKIEGSTTVGPKEKSGRRRSLTLRPQPEKRWSTKHEPTRKNTAYNTRCSSTPRAPLSSPIFTIHGPGR